MVKKAGDEKPAKGGRPAMGVKPTLVRLPLGVPERIDAIAGKGQRAEFIREATLAELERREAETAGAAQGQDAKPGPEQPR